mmetsp:Transcript_15991/g.18561  ORF Transcript_15991/g.18561 Transcript_15991/m.18561 type:complete len:102 (-) Transcript_15991:869-1174(-)
MIIKFIQNLHHSKRQIFFNVIIRIGLESYLVLFFASLYNTKTMTFENATDYYANFVSFTFLILLLGLLALVVAVVIFTKANTHPSKRVSILSKDFKEYKRL